MVGLIFLFLNLVFSLFKSKSGLEAENAALRQQLTVLRRKVRGVQAADQGMRYDASGALNRARDGRVLV